ncbi:lasso RiPP family leader peptide-containing protein [Saccharothrix sp. AJ9571]|nr:lasso RiPP family leader peptide-containing protein [Saccharothrix sp. AJ9571]
MDNEKMIPDLYEPPVLVELGEFSEDTLGGGRYVPDMFGLTF